MVRAAYSSGTPAIGVGPGNAPDWVCAGAADGEDDGIRLCLRILGHGAGHTAIIHTRSPRLQASFARQMPVSRVLVDTPAARAASAWATGSRRR